MKKYKVLKDSIGFKTGEVVEGAILRIHLEGQVLNSCHLSRLTDWFEEIKEPESQEEPKAIIGKQCETHRNWLGGCGCKHENKLPLEGYLVCPDCNVCYGIKPQPKKEQIKPSQRIRQIRERKLDWHENVEASLWVDSIMDFLDEHFSK